MNAPDAEVAHPQRVDHPDRQTHADTDTTTAALEIEAQRIRGAVAQLGQFHVFPVDNPMVPYCDGIKTRAHDPHTCKERGKHPTCKWSEWSTTDTDTIGRYWAGDRPRNIGIDCGKSNLLVIDEDATGEWERACKAFGVDVPATFTVRTGNGNHYYFQQPSAIALGNQEGALRGYKINVRGAGGYVVGPGSLHHTGIIYEIVDDTDPVAIPQEIVDAISGRASVTSDRCDDTLWTQLDGTPPSKDHDWWREGQIHHPDRHNAIAAAAGWCRRMNLHKNEARPIVRDVAARCVPHPEHGDRDEAYAYWVLDDIYARYEAGHRLEERQNGQVSGERVSLTEDDEDPFLNWAELFNRDTDDTDRWLYDDVLALGRGHAIYAGHKQGKSLFTIWVCFELATKRDDVDIIYLDYEMTADDVLERAEDMGYGPEDAAKLQQRFHYYLLPSMPALNTGEGAAALLQLVDKVQRPDCQVLVVVDTTIRANQGKENDADTFAEFYRWSGIALKRRGVTWVRLDHAGKNEDRGQRGSSGKGDDVDVIWKLVRQDAGVKLHKDEARMAWVREDVTFVRHTDPLRYEPTPYLYPAGTKELCATLDRLKVDRGASGRTARKVLKEAGIKAPNEVLFAAVKFRRSGVSELLRNDPEHSTEHSFGAPPEETTEQNGATPLTSTEHSTEHSGALFAATPEHRSTLCVEQVREPEHGTDPEHLFHVPTEDDLPCLHCSGPPHDTTTHMYVPDDSTPF